MSGFLEHALLAERGARHGFGLRGTPAPERVLRPRQVHGCAVVRLEKADAHTPLGDADAVVCDVPGARVAVVTADCVPILIAAPGARVVAAVHAGWRGLAAGVIDAALAELARAGARGDALAAAIGPHIGACCYEVDEPVLAPLRARFGAALSATLAPARAGHARLDLGALAHAALARALPERAIGAFRGACTRCDPARFDSHRRDAEAAGRMVHWIECANGT